MQFPEQIYRHATYSSVRAWRERLGRYRLVGSKCTSCGQLWFPRRSVCAKCSSRDLESYECSHEGEVVCHWENIAKGAVPMGYGEQRPRIPTVVKLTDGVHVFTEIIETSPEEVYDGMAVKMVLRKQKRESNSNWTYGYKFIPVSTAGQAEN